MKLRQLLAKIDLKPEANRALEQNVTGICTNSHACRQGDLFIGIPGSRVDGGEFWQSAIDGGAIAAIISPQAAAKQLPTSEACAIVTEDTIAVASAIAAAFYDYPAQKLNLVGVTGTNGKTTITHLVEYFLLQAKLSTALFGTLYTRWQGYQQTAVHTTPFAVELQSLLAQAVAAGNKYAVMEVSSHALDQGRVKGCRYEVAVFTNLTQDHLDYHPDMEAYFQAKSLLFSPEYLQQKAIINLDDAYGRRLLDKLDKQVWSYSVNNSQADLYLSELDYQPTGVSGILHTPVGEVPFDSPLVGQFNLANLLAAVGAVLHLGVDLQTISATLPQFAGVPGRMERVQISPEQDISVIVDYAHTPDSLENMLKASRPFISGKMICVFGCGGDRDRTKRPLMGKIAARLADVAVVTSDNPRTEDPQKILADVVAGIPDTANYKVVGDRATAIKSAITDAQPGDGILIAGKGHEDYQILGTEKIHFDDREQAREALKIRLSN
ncbi:UDP-N-acetylmuramoyl-L-alanyl-D-glutamate--2,6-diaminopimelate ligase [Myxosarcina sp. GI1]|uniref:UDP-N-acetylmuramoyl-L-alanyl-D-glutamate--2, 6-diaminopimelate ligase n=1 Tax=Myxosarcina sp. GI1 TaxID=1541065 RepID=UPI00055C95FC|nr:UDP-N-acetylmuramoyl-L-alanyl-D-glutamate--2,6-diaminopimelate ligase [Myxosarcina sp. GI1]